MNGKLVSLALLVGFAHPGFAQDEIPTTFQYFDPSAASVGVAGEFSNWEVQPMSKDDTGKWTRTISLKPGTHGYKFVVNGQDWVLDPKNPVRKTVGDVENSAIYVGPKGKVVFTYHNSTAKAVHLAGDFNNWLDNVEGRVVGKTEWLMQSDGAGNWKFTADLPPGTYKYKYVLDSDRWEKDPNAPAADDDNSMIEVTANASPVPQTVDVTFSYSDAAAKSVSLAGDFNRWNTNSHPMIKHQSGVWSVTFPLVPGRYAYKFVVDGNWKQDPENTEAEADGLGGSNSVRKVSR